MRSALLFICLTCAVASNASARSLTDREKTLQWCSGFYDELRFEAINNNNAMLHDKALANINSYHAEFTVSSIMISFTDLPDVGEIKAQQNQGALFAGRNILGGPPLFSNDERNVFERRCDLVAVQAEAFTPFYLKLMKKVQHTLAHNARK